MKRCLRCRDPLATGPEQWLCSRCKRIRTEKNREEARSEWRRRHGPSVQDRDNICREAIGMEPRAEPPRHWSDSWI